MARRRRAFSSRSCFFTFFLTDLACFKERTSFVILKFAQSRRRWFTDSNLGVSLLTSDAEPSDHKSNEERLVLVASDPRSVQIWRARSSPATTFLYLVDREPSKERTSFVISNFAQSRRRRFTGSKSGISLLGSDAEPSDHKSYGENLVMVASDPRSFQIWQASSTVAIFLYFVDRDLFSEHIRRLFRHIQCLAPHTSYRDGGSPSHNLRRHNFGLALSSYPPVANGYKVFSAYNRRSASASLDLVSESVSNCLTARLTEETLVSVSRRSGRASLVTKLGQVFGLRLRRMNLSWAWPINVLTWAFKGHLSFMDVKPAWPIRGSLLACPKLPILRQPQLSTAYVSVGCFLHIRLPSTLLSLLSPLRPVSAGDSAQLPPVYLSSVAPRLDSWNESVSTLQASLVLPDSSPHQPSSCQGQERTLSSSSCVKERTLSSSSCLKERTLSQKSFSMEGMLLLISLSKKMNYVLTALSSSVMVRTGLVKTTGNTMMRTEVMELSKSLVMLTNLMSVEESSLRTVSITGLLELGCIYNSPDHLSNFVKFVSLSLPLVCVNVLAIRVCPFKLIYLVAV